jgi:hypothetical protein
MPRIDLSDRAYQRLLRRSRSFDDNAESVIERLLDEVGAERLEVTFVNAEEPTDESGDDALLPESDYWVPILELLDDAGGEARGSRVIDALEAKVEDRLTDADRGVLSMGETRWRNRARFARLRMKERGYISRDSPRGMWEITDEGREFLRAERAGRGGLQP